MRRPTIHPRLRQSSAYLVALKIVGGVEMLALELGITRQAIYAWGGTIPAKKLAAVLKIVRKHARAQRRILSRRLPTKRELRPDLFTPKPRGAGRGITKPKGKNRGKAKKESRVKAPQSQEG